MNAQKYIYALSSMILNQDNDDPSTLLKDPGNVAQCLAWLCCQACSPEDMVKGLLTQEWSKPIMQDAEQYYHDHWDED